jgi:hypothetical protein
VDVGLELLSILDVDALQLLSKEFDKEIGVQFLIK